MIDLDRLIADFESCLGWPYASPGSTGRDCSASGIDCSGMFRRAYKLQGASIAHGSNTIWRRSLTRKGRISRSLRLRRGMAVFKWREEGDPQQDGLGNFYHIGLVTRESPLRIVHASTNGMQVRADDSAAGWTHWGALSGVHYPLQDLLAAPVQPSLPLLRIGSRGNEVVRLQLALRDLGYTLQPDGIFGPMTREAVKTYQATHGLVVDGLVGEKTWAALETAP